MHCKQTKHLLAAEWFYNKMLINNNNVQTLSDWLSLHYSSILKLVFDNMIWNCRSFLNVVPSRKLICEQETHPNATPSQPVNGSPRSCPPISRIKFAPKTKFYWGKGVEKKFNIKSNTIVNVIRHTSLLAKLSNQLLYWSTVAILKKGHYLIAGVE